MAWCDGPPVQLADDADPDAAAALILLALAHEAASAVEGLPQGSVEVVGSGLIARRVRALVGGVTGATVERPRALVEVTGDPEATVNATRRVADLGTVVLAGEALGRRTEMNLYADVHLRGLTLTGVGPPLADAVVPSPPGEVDDVLLEWCRESLVHVSPDSPVPAGAWYRVGG